MGIQPPTLEEWHALYTAAAEFRKIEAWKWMEPLDMFAVQDPAGGEIGYCTIPGPRDNVLGLMVKLGAQGLAAYGLQLKSELPFDKLARLGFVHKSIFMHFTYRGFLKKRDMNILKKLGLSFRDPDEWPQVRSFMVGYGSWYLTAEEARYFTPVLEQARDVALRFRDNPGLLEKPGISVFLTRVPEFDGDVLRWKDMWLKPPPLFLRPSYMAPVDEARLEKIRRTITRREKIFELAVFLIRLKIAASRRSRPYYPRFLILADCEEESLVEKYHWEPWTYAAAFHDRLLSFIETRSFVPLEIRVTCQDTVNLFKPITSALGIKLTLVEELPIIDKLVPWMKEARIE